MAQPRPRYSTSVLKVELRAIDEIGTVDKKGDKRDPRQKEQAVRCEHSDGGS